MSFFHRAKEAQTSGMELKVELLVLCVKRSQGGDPKGNPEYARGIISLCWLRNASGSSLRSIWKWEWRDDTAASTSG